LKPLIIAIATLIFALGVWLNNLDMRTIEIKEAELDHIAVQTATIASQYLDQYDYGQGTHTFEKDVCVVAIESYLKRELNLDDTMTPTNSYWVDTLE